MEERAKKGVSPHVSPFDSQYVQLTPLQLLSEEEKAVLAAEKADSKDGDCLIM